MARYNPKGKNKARIERAEEVATHYKALMGEEGPVDWGTIVDLFCDLRHYCEANNFDFPNMARIADDHFTAEFDGKE